MKHSYASEAKNYSSGAVSRILPDFIDRLGPTGRRNIVESLTLEVTYSLTVATAAVQGENVPGLFPNIIVNDKGGQRRNFTGPASRLTTIERQGPKAFQEVADIAVGAPSTGTFRMDIPFSDYRAKNINERCIPSDLMGEIALTWGTDATLDLGSSVVTIVSASVVVRANTYEDEGIKLYPRDIVKDELMDGLGSHRLQIGGFWDWSLAYENGDALSSMANWSTHRIEPIQLLDEPAAKKIWDYARNHECAANGVVPGGLLYNAPVMLATPKARVIWQTPGTAQLPKKLHDSPFLAGMCRVVPTNTVDIPNIVSCIYKPRNPDLDQTVRNQYPHLNREFGPDLGSDLSNLYVMRKLRGKGGERR